MTQQFTANEVRELAKHMESVGWRPDSKGDPECCDEGAARSAEMLFAFAAAIKQREQDTLDAARYRWLRDTQTTFGVSAQYDTAGKPIFYVRLHGFGTSADDVDAAIDAAMAKESGNG